jgi:hypothetical protein
MGTRLNNSRILNGEAKPLCEHGFLRGVCDRMRAWDERPESCLGRLRVDLRVYLPVKIPPREEVQDEYEGGAGAGGLGVELELEMNAKRWQT